MSLFRIFDVAGSAMSAQAVRLNVTASNLANAEVVSSTPEGAYRARQPVFATVFDGLARDAGGVRMLGVTESQAPVMRRHDPASPMADAAGYVYLSNVSAVEEMVNMMSASRSYQNSVEVLNTSKELLMRTLEIGR